MKMNVFENYAVEGGVLRKQRSITSSITGKNGKFKGKLGT